MTANSEQAFNPQIVQCLRILARRGRMIREQQEREAAAAAEATPGDDAEDLTFYNDKILGESAGGA